MWLLPIGMSPFRQRAAKNLFRSYIFNGYRRLSGELIYWSIPFALGMCRVRHVFLSASSRIFCTPYTCYRMLTYVTGYGVYTWAKGYDAWQNSKAAHVAGHEH